MTWCSTCRKEVPRGHVTIVGGSDRGSGVPTVRYGCTGQTPVAPSSGRAFIGRRDTPPVLVTRRPA